MNKLSNLLSIVLSSAIILLACNALAFAQEKLDKFPLPEGGLNTLKANVVYPKAAKDKGIEGKVIVVFTVDVNGNVIKADVRKPVHKDLDAAAIEAVKKTKFTPAEKDGRRVQTEICIPIKFKLDNCKEDKNGTEKKS
jgi:TonB family protein